jgi:DNA-binding SARP family transcriptional activator
VLALLAAHSKGRTLEEIIDDLQPEDGLKDVRAAVRATINSVRATLRKTTGVAGKYLPYDNSTGRYTIDPNLICVDLWRMLAAIDRANALADDDTACLAALREAADCYGGDFAEGQDRAWVIDYATTYRGHILSVYGRIAEILELSAPDQAIAALERAAELDPVNEEIAQRIMRIHGRQNRPDAVRRTLRQLENRIAQIGHAEVSETTRRVAARQLASHAAARGAA